MNRNAFRKVFKSVGPAVLPVIHVVDADQAERNVRTALREGAHGVFLINHDFPHGDLVPIIERIRRKFPSLWLGVNFLGVTGHDAFPVLGELEAGGCQVDAYWADDARIDERTDVQVEPCEIDAARSKSNWSGLYLGGTAFKKQRDVAARDYERAAKAACRHMDAVTTSGAATGRAADVSKIETFRKACGNHALAIASGVTPDNVHQYANLVDAILVATGINFDGDFYNTDPARLRRLISRVRFLSLGEAEAGHGGDRDDRWYFSIMSPNTKGEKFAWLDPTSIYINGRAFHDLLDDLCAELNPSDVDVVAGLDAMGFVLASAIATRLNKGFLPLRKAGKLCVDTDTVAFTNYSGRTQDMEMRKPAFEAGTRVLLVDQWVETGGTMAGAIELVERQGGSVAGIVSIVIEENERTLGYRKKYKCVSAIRPGTEWQRQANAKVLESFRTYEPEMAFPEKGA